MKKPKKTKKPKKPKAPADPNAKAKSGILGKLILPIVLGITSFSTVYFLPRAEPVVEVAAATQGEHEIHAPENTEPVPIETSFITLEPFTVSLKGRSRILRLSITVEAPVDMADMIDPKDPKLRDAFMGYLSALGMEQVGDAAFLVRLRAQLTRRARFVLGADSVHNILITDFMVR